MQNPSTDTTGLFYDPTREALHHYPWAVEINTHDGKVMTKYNMVRGTVLQPMQVVRSASLLAKVAPSLQSCRVRLGPIPASPLRHGCHHTDQRMSPLAFQLSPSREAEQRKLAYAANGRLTGSVGLSHGASGMASTVFR